MSFNVGDHVVVVDEGNNRWTKGKTGKVVFVQTDGSLLVDGLSSGFMDALTGWPAYRPEQLRPV
ncbi:hypothetical protein ACIQU4_17395 [Streptomyces sp. NPDC090741]|uniref:hypothetical protein n=1 Tax=Streptomyces sp. NPDC090741 TaxID=3365967 RepID=UPI00381E3BFB